MKYVIGIDIGTSGTKTVLFDEKGRALKSSLAEYPLYQPQNGYAEQNPADWYNAAAKTVKDVISQTDVNSIIGIGLSGQMHGLVMLDEKNEVIRPSIIWCDQRTSAECKEITEKVGAKKLIEITANPALTGFTASKILWVRNNEPENYKKCRHILLPKDYVRFKMTGVYATEVSDASGMQLLDIAKRCWSDEVLRMLDINPEFLPKVYESPEITGYIDAEFSRITGLPEGIPVVGGAGDNAAAAIGTGVAEDNKAFTTIGTSGVVFAHTSQMKIDPLGRIHTFCAAVPGCWHVMGVTQGAGLSLKWFRDNFCTSEKETAKLMNCDEYYLMDMEAKTVPIGADRLFYLPYLMGERTPHLDPDARGVFFGISAVHTKKHMLRAVMEGVVYSLRDCIEVFREIGIESTDMTACGGGGKSPLWRQMLADVYGCSVKIAAISEGPALGVAILALVGTGIYKSVEEACAEIVRTDVIQPPIKENSAQYEKYYELYREIYPSLKSNFKKLSTL